MKVLETVEVKLEWRDLDNLVQHPRPERGRCIGKHVSDILRCIMLTQNMFTREDADDTMPLRVLLGLGFEQQAAQLYANIVWQPGEFTRDGISGNPDGISLLDEYDGGKRICVDEFKYTGKSQRVKGSRNPDALKDIRDEWMWIQQGASYLNLLQADYDGIDLVRFHICWKYGVYGQWPITERYYRYLVQYTDAELRGNWAMMMKFKDEAEEEAWPRRRN